MINSLFMLGSSYNKNKIISKVFMVAWIAYMIFGSKILTWGLTFPMVNAIIFMVITLLINKVKDRNWNTLFSIASILIWSVVIDTLCYFMYPTFVGGLSIFQYIYQGLLFNARYVVSNTVAVIAINVVIWICTKVKVLTKAENC